MAVKFDIRVEGLKEFEGNLRLLREQYGVRTGGIINRSLLAGARVIRDEAKRRAPVLKDYAITPAQGVRGQAGYRKRRVGTRWRERGAIKRNIIAHFGRDKGLSAIVRVRNRGYIFAKKQGWGRSDRMRNPALAGNPNYWWLVEFGTSKMQPRPFMRPAFMAKKHAALDAFKARMRREIRVLSQRFARPMKIAA